MLELKGGVQAAETLRAVMGTEDENGAVLCVMQRVKPKKIKKKSGGKEQACLILVMAMAYFILRWWWW